MNQKKNLQTFCFDRGKVKHLFVCVFFFVNPEGYDGLPIESMQGLDINSGGNSVYNANEEDNYGTHQQHLHQQTPTGDHFDNEVPQPPNDNNQVAAWYDTDL